MKITTLSFRNSFLFLEIRENKGKKQYAEIIYEEDITSIVTFINIYDEHPLLAIRRPKSNFY
jgi:hypothetical protein